MRIASLPAILAISMGLNAQEPVTPVAAPPDPENPPPSLAAPRPPGLIDRTGAAAYGLGPGDKIIVRALDMEEFSEAPIAIDRNGNINLPLVGRVQAGGRTMEQLEAEITERLKRFLLEPQVTVSIAQFQSRPVSVFGSVGQPGVLQLEGPKTLYEVISMAGGLSNEVGDTIRVTRRVDSGDLPLPEAHLDSTGKFVVAEINVRDIMEMTNPDENITVMPHDVITVSRADIVYVVGNVNRGGGFVTKGNMSVLEALSLAGGFSQHAARGNARILRVQPNTDQRLQIAVDLKQVLKGKSEDLAMRPDDILFVPNSSMKQWTDTAVKAAISTTSGVIIWRAGRY